MHTYINMYRHAYRQTLTQIPEHIFMFLNCKAQFALVKVITQMMSTPLRRIYRPLLQNLPRGLSKQRPPNKI